MRGLGGGVIRYFVGASVALAIWQGFEGDLGSVAWMAWTYVQQGADVVTDVWHGVQG